MPVTKLSFCFLGAEVLQNRQILKNLNFYQKSIIKIVIEMKVSFLNHQYTSSHEINYSICFFKSIYESIDVLLEQMH